MKSFRLVLLGGLLISVPVVAAFACAGPPPAFYAPPNYIDPGYEPPEWTDVVYGPRTKFSLLLNDFVDKPAKSAEQGLNSGTQAEDKDAEFARNIVALLKSKNITAPPDSYKKFAGCGNNSRDNALLFLRAAFSDSAVGGGFEDLVKIRYRLLELCDAEDRATLAAGIAEDIRQMQSRGEVGAYAEYLRALLALYGASGDIGGGSLSDALEILRRVQEKAPHARWWHKYWGGPPSSTWLHQTAVYLIARLQLAMAQKDWDGYSDPVVDSSLVQAAKQAYAAYLQLYPQGLYADSARNIQRKIYHFEDNFEALNRELAGNVNRAFGQSHFSVTELEAANSSLDEYKRFFEGPGDYAHDAPLIVVFGILRQDNPGVQALAQVQARQNDFAPYPGLFRFLQAYLLFKKKDYARLLELTPGEAPASSVAWLSTEAIRARAFEAVGNKAEALKAWQNIARLVGDDQAQLHIAALFLAEKDFAGLFSVNSGIKDEHVLGDFALFGLNQGELANVLAMDGVAPGGRALAAKALFRQLLLQRRYADLAALLQQHAPGDVAKDVAQAVAALAKEPGDAAALVVVGKFVYENYLRPDSSLYVAYNQFSGDIAKELQAVCGSCRAVENAIPPIADFLKAEDILAQRRQKSETEAQALHFLVKCFRGAEFADRCQWGQKNTNRGSAWFELLHNKYPRSPWTKLTPYHY